MFVFLAFDTDKKNKCKVNIIIAKNGILWYKLIRLLCRNYTMNNIFGREKHVEVFYEKSKGFYPG